MHLDQDACITNSRDELTSRESRDTLYTAGRSSRWISRSNDTFQTALFDQTTLSNNPEVWHLGAYWKDSAVNKPHPKPKSWFLRQKSWGAWKHSWDTRSCWTNLGEVPHNNDLEIGHQPGIGWLRYLHPFKQPTLPTLPTLLPFAYPDVSLSLDSYDLTTIRPRLDTTIRFYHCEMRARRHAACDMQLHVNPCDSDCDTDDAACDMQAHENPLTIHQTFQIPCLVLYIHS